MDGDSDVLATVRTAFAECPRPEHFTDHTHCQECAEYDEFLQTRTPDTLLIEDVENPGSDPICFVGDAGFAYLFPGLARLALTPSESGNGWYLGQFLFHLTHDWETNRRMRALTQVQRHAVADLLRHLALTRSERIDEYYPTFADEFLYAIAMWSGEPGAHAPGFSWCLYVNSGGSRPRLASRSHAVHYWLEARPMPLRDHFHPPLDNRRSWSELHGGWPMVIVQQIRPRLPDGYTIGPGVTLGTQFELDVATFEDDDVLMGPSDEGEGGVATAVWAPPAPSVAVSIDLPGDTYEVRVYDLHRARQLVAVVEIISPSNKDRPATREVLVGKCAALLRAGVSVSLVDVVTNRGANLYAELMTRLGVTDAALGADPPGIYAATCRLHLSPSGQQRTRLRAWAYPLAVGKPLPTLPLWLSERLVLPLDLEASYEKACADLGIP